MADQKISQLGAAGAITGAELIEIVQIGVNVQSTVGGIQASANAYADSLVATTITAAQKYTFSALPDANYQLVLSDAVPLVKFLTLNSSSARTITLPTDATAAIPIGQGPIAILNLGSADITIVAEAGATVVNYSTVYTIPPLSMATVIKRAANTWRLENVTAAAVSSVAGLTGVITAAALNAALGGWTRVVTTADQTTTSTSYADVAPATGPALAFAITAGVPREYRGYLYLTSNVTTEGAGISINGPTLTARYGGYGIPTSSSAITQRFGTTYDVEGATASTSDSQTPGSFFGRVECSATGTVAIRIRAETGAANSVVVKAGSYVEYRDAS